MNGTTAIGPARNLTPAALVPDRGYKVLDYGLTFTRVLSGAEWRALGRHLAGVHNRTVWAIGDWLNAGRDDDDQRGADYAYAKDVTGRSYESLSQLARVSRAFPIDRRTVAVPWSFYREVLRVEETERARTLMIAAYNKWTRDDLADYINGRGDPPLSIETTTPATVAADRTRRWKEWKATRGRQRNHHVVICPHCGHKFEPRRPRKVP